MRLFLLFSLLLVLANASHAQEFKSEYTSVDVKKCKFLEAAKPGEGEWARWRCRGYDGIDVYVGEGDLRFFINFDRKVEGRQTLSSFNTIGKNLEWRLEHVDGVWEPFATILRYYTDNSNGKKGQVLVVGKYDRGKTCHVAYIDALANKNANRLAQYIADKLADRFNCKTDEALIVGKSGVSPM